MREVRCDQCEADITWDGTHNRTRLRLTAERRNTGNTGGFTTAEAWYWPIDRDHDFCTLTCLREWLGDDDG